MAKIGEWENEIGKRRLSQLEEIVGALKTLREWAFFSKEFSDAGLGAIDAMVKHRIERKKRSSAVQYERAVGKYLKGVG